MSPGPLQQELVLQHGHVPGEPESFQDQLRDALKASPWYFLSLAFHGALFLILMNVEWGHASPPEEVGIVAEMRPEDLEVLEEEVVPPEPEEPEEIEEVLEDPVVTDQEVETLEAAEDHDFSLEAPFEGRALSDVIGAGGGGRGDGGIGQRRRSGAVGGSASQKAVDLGLRWLRDHQDPAGFWDCDDFQARCQVNLCSGRGEALHDVGVTGLALLAFLGEGNTMKSGRHREVVQTRV